ncbi:hypothetical protein J3459_017017 [Metarhizium acridum]|nr:hypothetical protein J3459_017017 [Metarhizium acridum]
MVVRASVAELPNGGAWHERRVPADSFVIQTRLNCYFGCCSHLDTETTMAGLVAVALHHRDHFSQGNARRTFGYEAYHWGIIVMPQTSQGRDCHAFDATDASDIDPVTFRLKNPTMDWWFRSQTEVDLELGTKLIGRIVIGHVPDEVSAPELGDFFGKVPLPVKNTHPQQSCVTWVEDAIRNLQEQGWVQKFNIDRFKDWALSYADERMKGADSSEPSVKYYNVES